MFQLQGPSAKTLGDAIRELITAKTVANRRHRYIVSLRQYLAQFSRGRESVMVSSIGAADVEAWFASRSEAPTTRASNLGRLSSLFAFACRRGYCVLNPIDAIEKPFLEPQPVRILTVEQAHLLLHCIRRTCPQWLPYLALGLFAGVRPEELERLGWDAVDLDRGLLRIPASVAKTRLPRLVYLSENCVRWLRLGGRMPISRSSRRRLVKRMRAVLGWSRWPQDILRHTAASMMLSRDEDAGKVSLQLGNSPKILLRHYRELVTGPQANRFWA